MDMIQLLKGSDSTLFQIFLYLFRIFPKISGYISLHVLFLENSMINQAEIWPWALPNYSTSILVMKKGNLCMMTEIIVVSDCPQLYVDLVALAKMYML